MGSERALRRRGALPRAVLAMLWLAAGVAVPVFSRDVQAQAPGEEPSASEKETARALMREGDAHFEAARFEQAREAYAAADAIMHVPTTGLSLGKAQERLGLWVEARDTWLNVTRYIETPGEPTPFTRARQEAARLAAEIASRIPTLVVTISGPAGVQPTVRLDGAALKVWTVPNRANPGQHRLEVNAVGHIAEVRELMLEAGQEHRVEIVLRPEPERAAAVPPAGAGSQDAFETDAQSSAPAAAEPSDTTPSEPAPASSTDQWPMWIGFGVGALGLTTGSYFGLSSLSATDDLRKQCPNDACPPDSQEDLDEANLHANIANIGFAVGALGIGFGLWQLFSLSADGDDGAQADTSLNVGLTPGALRIEGTF